MATVNKREWTNKDGSKSSSWRVQYKDGGGVWRRKDFERQADAKRFADTIASKVQSGEHVSAGATVTVADLARRYVDALESGKDGKAKVEPHHVLTTRGQVENHIIPHIGALKLTALTIARVQSFRDTDLADQTDNNRRVIVNLLSAICRFAISKQMLGLNPVAGEIPKRSKRGKRKVTILSKKDINTLLTTARSWITGPPMVRSAKRPPVTPFYIADRDRWRIMATGPDGKRFAKTYKTKEAAIAAADVIAGLSGRMVPAVSPRLARWGFSLIAFLVGTGCRVSEARGAPRKGLDLNAATFRVFQRADAKGKIGPPKSESGARTIQRAISPSPTCANFSKRCRRLGLFCLRTAPASQRACRTFARGIGFRCSRPAVWSDWRRTTTSSTLTIPRKAANGACIRSGISAPQSSATPASI